MSYAVLAGSTVTNTGPTVVTGDLGVSPGTAVTGFPPGQVNGGAIHSADANTLQAQTDTTTVYNALAGQSCDRTLTGTDLGGLTLTAGTYCFSSSAQLTGTLTLDAQGDPSAVFVFQMGSTLTTASNSSVAMINGGNPCNVYWQVGSSATLGTSTAFDGNIVALASITLTTDVSVTGRALARTAAVTMDTNVVDASSCSGSTPNADGGGAADAISPSADACLDVIAPPPPVIDSGTAPGTDADEGKTYCGWERCNLHTDSHHCGSCDNVCGWSESCVDGECRAHKQRSHGWWQTFCGDLATFFHHN